MAIPGTEFLSGINWGGILSKTSLVIVVLTVVAIIGGIIIFIYSRIQYNKSFKYNIPISKDINGEWVLIEQDTAREIRIPNTNLKLLYLRNNQVYLPFPKLPVGKKTFWYGVLKTGEWVNYKQKSLDKEMSEMSAEFDTSESKLLYVNQQKVLQDHYKNKASKWWKEYKEIISTVVLIFVWSISIFLLFGKLQDVIGGLEGLIEQIKLNSETIKQTAEILKETKAGTGVIKVGSVILAPLLKWKY